MKINRYFSTLKEIIRPFFDLKNNLSPKGINTISSKKDLITIHPNSLVNANYTTSIARPMWLRRSYYNKYSFLTFPIRYFSQSSSNTSSNKQYKSNIGWLAIFGTGLAAFGIYNFIRDWYFDFPIEVGDYPTTAQNFVETQYHQEFQEKLKRDYKDNTNKLVLVGASGTGKTVSLGEAFVKTESWFRRGWLIKRKRPWLKLWISIGHDVQEDIMDLLIKQQMLELARKIHNNTLAALNKETFTSKTLLFIKDKLPFFLQKYFTFKIIENDQEDTLRQLKCYLEDHPGWVIAFDNVAYYRLIEQFIPKKGGIIIITTNNEALENNKENRIEFSAMNDEEGYQFIKQHLAEQHEDIQINSLRNEMGHLPLAMAQACGYINSTKISINEYLDLVKNMPLFVLDQNSEIIKKHPTLVRTLNLALKRFKDKHQKSESYFEKLIKYFYKTLTPEEKLLFIISLLSSADIPVSLLESSFYDKSSIDEIQQFKKATQLLIQFCIINRKDNNYFVIHPLIQKILRGTIEDRFIKEPGWLSWRNFKFLYTKPTLLDAVLKAITIEIYKNFELNQFVKIFDHIVEFEKLMSEASPKQYNRKLYADFLDSVFKYLMELENSLDYSQYMNVISKIPDAKEQSHKRKALLERTLRIKEAHYGKDHRQVAMALNNLATVYGDLGDAQQQKVLLERALSIFEAHYGKDHWKAASTLNNLANAYGDLGDAQQQKALLERALPMFESHYGKDHWQVAMALNNLASAYGGLGDAQQKKALLERALRIYESHYGKDHWHVASTLNNLANAYGDLGDAQQKKALLERALKIYEFHYGKDHWKAASTLNNLATAYGDLGDAQQEKILLERALKIEESHYGKDHWQTASTLNNLATAYGDLGDAQQKKALLKRVLRIYESHYGKDHWHVASTLNNLASAYSDLGDAQQKKALLERALPIFEAHYGKDHWQVASMLNNLATAYGDLGDAQQQRALLERALKIKESHYGKDHWQTASTLNNLANAYGALGDAQQKKALLERVLLVVEAHYGKDHWQTASMLNNLATAYGDLGDAQQQKVLLERALPIFEAHYGKDHWQVASPLVNLANAYGDLGDAQQKKVLLERALKIDEAHYGKDHWQTASTLNSLANAYGDLGDAQQKKALLERALKIKEAHYGKDHWQVAMTLGNLANAYGALGDAQQKKALLERALPIFEAHYGKDHRLVAMALYDLAQTYLALKDLNNANRAAVHAYKAFKNCYGDEHLSTQKAALLVQVINNHSIRLFSEIARKAGIFSNSTSNSKKPPLNKNTDNQQKNSLD